MKNIEFLYCFVLCLFFIFLNYKKVFLGTKSLILPSTFFAFGWALSSLGCLLYSNDIMNDANTGETSYLYTASYLPEIGTYLFNILIASFLGFSLAHIKTKNQRMDIPWYFGEYKIPQLRKKMRFFLYGLFILGSIRFVSVINVTGFDISAMRHYYIATRHSFSSFDLNLIRICSYLSIICTFYIVLLGIEQGSKGLNIKDVLKDFLLFSPFRLSFGGRLFILQFFAPFVFSFLTSLFNNNYSKEYLKNEKRKFIKLCLIPLSLIVIMQIFKSGKSISGESSVSFITELFYTSSAYIRLNELWKVLPNDFEIGYGKGFLGITHPIYKNILIQWEATGNKAYVCIPSMIPQMLFDFGNTGSLFAYFIGAFLLEFNAIRMNNKMSIISFLMFIQFCAIGFSCSNASLAKVFYSLISTYLLLVLFNKIIFKDNKT